MNSVTLVGYLSFEPEVKNTTSGTPLTRFSLGVNDLRGQDSYFIPCVAWNQTATYVANNLNKGDFVAVNGRLIRRKYMNKEGKETYVMEVVADNVRNYGKSKNRTAEDSVRPDNNEPHVINIESAFEQPKPVQYNKTQNNSADSSIDWDEE